jgi:hypothetical protein
MARSMVRSDVSHDDISRFSLKSAQDFEDSWPEEPTAVDAAMTMEEMIVEELRRQGSLPPPDGDAVRVTKKGTLIR